MSTQPHLDLHWQIKYHLFQTFFLALALFGMYKVLVVEVPHGAILPTPPSAHQPAGPAPCAGGPTGRQRKRGRQKVRGSRKRGGTRAGVAGSQGMAR